MRLRPKSCPFRKNPLTSFTILFIALFYFGTDVYQQNYLLTNPDNRGVIHWDAISYYAYLPATFIYGDVTLDFLNNPPEGFVNDNKFWPSQIENGNFLILTTMGLAVMYSPFFFMAHALSPVFGEARDGFGSVYQFFLVFGAFVYAILGLIILKNLLRRYFSTRITVLTLLAVGLGTNLYHFATTEAAMAHAYLFFLIVLFLWMVMRWYQKPSILNTILIGALFGLITLIRPTNILILLVLIFWNVKSWNELGERILFFLKKFYLVLFMLSAFLIVWTPQFLYWKAITGHYLYFTYSTVDGAFYWGNPHIIDNLFSFKKGWFIYVPIMFFAVLGIPLLKRRKPAFFWPSIILLIPMIYVLSSWWSWWFGGCFGLRAYIDIYGIMAFPLAATLEYASERKMKWIRMGYPALIVLLVMFHLLNTYQYNRKIIHYVGMNKEVYFKTFLKIKHPPDFWQSLTIPDYYLARRSIYVYYNTGEDNSALLEMRREDAYKEVRRRILDNKKLHKEIQNYARRTDLTYEEAMQDVTVRIFENLTEQ